MANRIPSILNVGEFHTSFWYRKEANLSYLHEIGCKADVHKELPDADQGEQLDPNVEESIFSGCHENPPTYMVLVGGMASRFCNLKNVTSPHKSQDPGASSTGRISDNEKMEQPVFPIRQLLKGIPSALCWHCRFKIDQPDVKAAILHAGVEEKTNNEDVVYRLHKARDGALFRALSITNLSPRGRVGM